MKEQAPVRVALCAGVLYRRDAISHSLRLKLQVLRRWRDEGEAIDVRAFVLDTDEPADDVWTVGDAWRLATDPWFASADLAMFEFGIRYPLFDALHLDTRAVRLGVFHNVTPRHLVDGVDSLAAIDDSMRQLHVLDRCAEVVCDSPYNERCLRDLGVRVRTSVLELPPAVTASTRPIRRAGDVVELLYVGRLVRSKGVADLVEAFSRVVDSTTVPVRLVLAGGAVFSDRSVLDSLTSRPGDLAAAPAVTVALDLDDDELAERYARADVVVLPSYHEGYGVPVVEALASGCRVVTSDAGALPDTVAGLGTVVPVGDVDALARALATEVERVASGGTRAVVDGKEVATNDWASLVAERCSARSAASFEAGFRSVLARHSAVLR